ncbi:MAG TPA: GNAT family N-acetyltransferase [Candidatus Limnocylindria bacterium]|nr:GNAT family N-acetyltransferase [Candidatus Limnocylindria bacterium]
MSPAELGDLGLAVRPATLDDAPRLFDLVAAVDLHDFGDVDMTVEEVRDDMAGSDLVNDSWLVTSTGSPDGPLVAYAALELHGEGEYRGQVSVHPDWRRRGVGSALAKRLEASVRERLDPRSDEETPILGFLKGDSPQLRWAEQLGYVRTRRFLRMRIELDGPPPEAEWPDGITVRDFVPGQDERAMYEAQEAAFSDHWGHVTRSFEDWSKRLERSDFDPGLWHLAVDGDDVVATTSNSYLPDGVGWVSGLGVVASHRRRGLARAILLHSFGVFWQRGMQAVALGVDSESLTGATRLYESVGMRVVQQYDQVRKLVRYSTSTE